MIYSHGVVIRRVWVDVRVSERPSLVFSWELKVRNDTEPTDSSPSPGSGEGTAMRRTDRARDRGPPRVRVSRGWLTSESVDGTRPLITTLGGYIRVEAQDKSQVNAGPASARYRH